MTIFALRLATTTPAGSFLPAKYNLATTLPDAQVKPPLVPSCDVMTLPGLCESVKDGQTFCVLELAAMAGAMSAAAATAATPTAEAIVILRGMREVLSAP